MNAAAPERVFSSNLQCDLLKEFCALKQLADARLCLGGGRRR